MASTSNTTKKASSRWGSFLAGVESRLDTILADEDTSSNSQKKEDGGLQTQAGEKEVPRASKVGEGGLHNIYILRSLERLTEIRRLSNSINQQSSRTPQ